MGAEKVLAYFRTDGSAELVGVGTGSLDQPAGFKVVGPEELATFMTARLKGLSQTQHCGSRLAMARFKIATFRRTR